ncbi:MAG: DUF2335 domain-containing protein [Acetobacteraceae bacterium]|nr:DUF2335 domain-containing protein [Acetobacteraceae bacterium]
MAPTVVGMSVRQEATATLHMGPIPAPAEFGSYNEIVPGAAERILAMAEADAAHVRLAQRRAQVFLFAERMAARVLSAVCVSSLGVGGLLGPPRSRLGRWHHRQHHHRRGRRRADLRARSRLRPDLTARSYVPAAASG